MALTTVKKDAEAPQPAAAQPAIPPPGAGQPGASGQAEPAATAAGGAKGGLRKKILLGVAAVAAVGVVWFAGDWFLNGRFNISTDNAQLRSDIARVTPKVEGYVKAIHVVENQTVKRGDLLIELESDEFQTRLAFAKAELAQAVADATQSRARITAQRDNLAEARAAREAADASADLSSSDEKRLAELAEKGWYPKARLEQAEAARRTADAQLSQATATITAQRSQLSSAEAAALSADAKVQAAQAKVEAAQLELDRTRILAPMDGVVTKKDVVEGQILSPGRVALSIVSSNDVWVVANFKETQITDMRAGQCVNVHVDALPSLHVTGKIQSLSPSTGATFSLVPQDTATGNFTKIVQRVPVKILLDKEALATGLLRTGMQVTATVSTKPDCE
ncbi:MAG TPA: HlyD family secretion protein [Hyphomonadaceae bacterium]|jgi:membrane fusion protein (multidrug efflux system)|nr:HlyD family secretion protein [Hyphomonadaceae bacterium]